MRPAVIIRTPFVLIWTCAFAVAVGAADDAGQPDADRKLTRQLSKLVQQFNEDRAAERDAAEAKLLELAGSTTAETERVLELLPATSEQMPLAVRERLSRVRRQLEQRVAKDAVERTTVTLSASDRSINDILAEIARQTGNQFDMNRIDGERIPTRKLSVNLKNEPFWPAVDRILDEASLGIYPYGDDKALSIVARVQNQEDRRSNASYSGPFRIELLELQSQRNLRQPARDSLKLKLEVAWEPRLRPIAVSQPLAAVEARTDDESAIAVAQPEAVLNVEVPRGTQAAEIILPFELPPRDANQIATLRGTLQALVPGRQAKFSFDDLANASGETQRRGGVQVTLDDVRKNEEIWELRMRFALDEAHGALQSHRGWVFQNPSYLVGKDGEPLDYVGFETTRQTPNEVGVVYLFDLPDGIDGVAWVYETPAAMLEVPVQYEFDNIRLP